MKKSNNVEKPDSRGRVKSDFPKHTLEEALKVARALAEKNGGQPLPPTETAIAIGVSPGSSEFRVILSSSIKYGLTSGSFNAERVALDTTGRSIVEPNSREEEQQSLLKAALAPPTFQAAYDYFKGKKLPDEVFLQNTLVREFGVPRDHAAKCASVFVKNMDRVGLIRNASTGKWLTTDLGAATLPALPTKEGLNDEPFESAPPITHVPPPSGNPIQITLPTAPTLAVDARLSKVFITHGKNTAFISPIKDLLSFGQLEAVVSVEKESVAQPVPDKVLNDMRSCGAAIIHVDGEMKLIDGSAQEHVMLNPNVLIEIGAAMALYGRRFILLVRQGVKLPSNLQGLYEVRYDGDKLDGEVTIRLLRAINELKSQPLPIK